MRGRYKLDGHKPVPVEDLIEWAMWFEKADEERRVAFDKVGEDIEVSTIFLGLDFQFGGGAPVLFETQVFGGPRDGWQSRCLTWEQAEEQHKIILAREEQWEKNRSEKGQS